MCCCELQLPLGKWAHRLHVYVWVPSAVRRVWSAVVSRCWCGCPSRRRWWDSSVGQTLARRQCHPDG
jgi:hypothetical protein